MEPECSSTGRSPAPPAPPQFIRKPGSLLATLRRMRTCNDNVAYRTTGGLRVMIRNDPDSDSEEDLSFDVSIVTEDETPAIVKSIKNEIDIMEDDAGCIVIEEYSFSDTDADSLQSAVDFLNAVDLWTVCPCGEYLIKDKIHNPALEMCYYCELTNNGDLEDVFCPICHENGASRWMVTTSCCNQKMHKKCKETCIATDVLRDPRCPMCRTSW
jgi:hypothetical protein